jgi:hypothetical protein
MLMVTETRPAVATQRTTTEILEDNRHAFPEWIAGQARWHHLLSTLPNRTTDNDRVIAAFNAWLAAKLDELADTARSVEASTPEQYDDRVAMLEAERELALQHSLYAADLEGRDVQSLGD